MTESTDYSHPDKASARGWLRDEATERRHCLERIRVHIERALEDLDDAVGLGFDERDPIETSLIDAYARINQELDKL